MLFLRVLGWTRKILGLVLSKRYSHCPLGVYLVLSALLLGYHISGVRTHIQKVKPKIAEFEELYDINPSPLRGQRSHKNTYTIQIKGSTIDIFNFVVFKSTNGTKITELAALRPIRGLRLTSYSSFNFRHLWLHFTYCSNMRSSYSRYIWTSLA